MALDQNVIEKIERSGELKKCLATHGLSLLEAEEILSNPMSNPARKMAVLNSRIQAAKNLGLLNQRSKSSIGGTGNSAPYSPSI